MNITDLLIAETTQSGGPFTYYMVKNAAQIASKYPYRYSKPYGHHVTVQFGVPAGTHAPPMPESIKIVGYANSGDGLEAFVVSVNGSTTRPDGKLYHLTWSLDPAVYSPKDSNELLAKVRYKIVLPIELEVVPVGVPERRGLGANKPIV